MVELQLCGFYCKDSRAISGVDTRDGHMVLHGDKHDATTKVPMKDPCPLESPEMLRVARCAFVGFHGGGEVRKDFIRVPPFVYLYVSRCTRAHIHIYIYMYTYIRTKRHARVYVHMCTYIYIYMQIQIHRYTCILMNIVYIYTHTDVYAHLYVCIYV